MEKRSMGKRRWGLEVSFPLLDSNGVTAIRDRRSRSDRRRDHSSPDERLMLDSGMPGLEAGPGENR